MEEFSATIYNLGKVYVPKQEEFRIRNDEVVDVATGDRHSLIVTEKGRVFAFGDNSSGQLGLGHTDPIERISSIKSLKFVSTDEKAILAACGRESSLVATNNGSIYGFGSNIRFQLGFESKNERSIEARPIRIKDFPSKIAWKRIAMGAEHSCALTVTGELYLWGSNEDGQCGQIKRYDTIRVPRKLPFKEKITSISCGYYHTGFISNDGKLFLFGNNDDNQLSQPTHNSNHFELHEVSTPFTVKAIACGYQHTVLLAADGNVYTCGRGDRGQLGLGPEEQLTEGFEHVAGLPKRLTGISAGEGHTAAFNVHGSIFVFGDGTHGKLGFRNHSNQYFPCFVDQFENFHISNVLCGGCQMIVVAKRKKEENFLRTNLDDENRMQSEISTSSVRNESSFGSEERSKSVRNSLRQNKNLRALKNDENELVRSNSHSPPTFRRSVQEKSTRRSSLPREIKPEEQNSNEKPGFLSRLFSSKPTPNKQISKTCSLM